MSHTTFIQSEVEICKPESLENPNRLDLATRAHNFCRSLNEGCGLSLLEEGFAG